MLPSLTIIYIYIDYIHPELRIGNLPFSIRKGSRAALEGAAREQQGSREGAGGSTKGALWGSAEAQQVGACDEPASVAYIKTKNRLPTA